MPLLTSFDSVTNMTQDAATLTTTLTAQAVPLSDVAGSYNLDFGHPVAVPQAHRLKRSFGKAILGDFEKSESADFPIDAGRQNQRVNVFTDSKCAFCPLLRLGACTELGNLVLASSSIASIAS